APAAPRRAARPRLESLEGRLAPAIFTVTTTLDAVAADRKLSLREAVSLANARPGPDVIQLKAGLYRIGLAGSEDAHAAGDFDVTGPLTVQGQGAATTIIDGGRLDRLFDVIGKFGVAFSGLTLRNGAGQVNGGAVQAVDASLRLAGCVV